VDVNCAWCLQKETPAFHIVDDAHIFLCPGPSYNGEHHLVRDAIIQLVEEVARTAEHGALVVRREAPLLTLPCVEPLSDQERAAALHGKPAQNWPRLVNMDIYQKHIGADDNAFQHNLYDVTVTSPPGDWTSKNASDPVARSRRGGRLATCGVMVSLSAAQAGWPSASGSGSNTSSTLSMVLSADCTF
jgi:hypothetical protein